MANAARSNVTLLGSWPEGGICGKRRTALAVEIALTSAGSGAADNKIPASAFGLSSIEEVSPLVNDSNDLVIVGTPNFDGSELLLKAAATNAPASYTDTFRCVVKGQTSAA